MFVVAFEGLDKSGKETCSKLLYEALENQGMKVAHMAFPRYHTELGKQIRNVLDGDFQLSIEEMATLYELDRVAAQADIQKFEDDGVAVLIIDRYVMSNLYAVARGLPKERLESIQASLSLRPADLHIFVDIPVEESIRRGQAYEKLDIFEVDVDLLQRVRSILLDVSEQNYYTHGGRIVRINGLNPRDIVFTEACQALVSMIGDVNATRVEKSTIQ